MSSIWNKNDSRKRGQSNKIGNTTFKNISFVGCIQKILPDIQGKSQIQKLEQDAKQVTSRSASLKRMLSANLGMMDTLIEDGEEEEISNINEQPLEQASTNVETTRNRTKQYYTKI